MGVYDIDGNSVESPSGVWNKQTVEVLVASATASDEIKASANYVCTGTNDEAVIQNAINYVAENKGGKVRLSEGIFYISAFPHSDSAGDNAALVIPQKSYFYPIEIIGAMPTFGAFKSSADQKGTVIQVSYTCYEILSNSNKYTILRGGYIARQRDSSIHLTLSDVDIQMPSNQKKITCIDVLYINRVLIERVFMRGCIYGYNGFSSGDVPPVAAEGCNGLRGIGGSNSGVMWDLRNVLAWAFHTGFNLGGEHLIGINLSALQSVYGYQFGNYTWTGAFLHPMTLINCCDENNINLPLFHNNTGKQAVNLIDFNMEWGVLNVTPGGAIGDHAKETTPGTFCGNINYTMCYGGVWVNTVTQPFWESGSGHSIQTKNDAQELSGTSVLRRTYAPNFMQQYFDTTANKLLICTDPANKTWVDADGNVVS